MRDAAVVFVAALVARLAVVAWAAARFPAVEDGHYYDVLARRLASGQGYTWLWPDGAVTYAAHYPVGYPALVAAGYAIFGARTGVAMVVNALVGAAGCLAIHTIVDGPNVPRWRPLAAGLAVAVHPALVPYTAALMTEGVTTALIAIAAALALHAARAARPAAFLAGCAVVLAGAVLVRPQSLALAPFVGALAAGADAGWRVRLRRAAAVTGIALACIAPWTARNCSVMHRCALVSVNGGWNLLIGAVTTSGGWQPVPVPSECATVWDEAAKDTCFEHAGLSAIRAAPASFFARVPAKLAYTFDYFGAAPWYLHASNPAAFDDRAKVALGAVEVLASRLLLLGALVACGRLAGPNTLARKAVALAGAAAAVTLHAWIGYLSLVACAALLGARALLKAPPAVLLTAVVVLVTAAIHGVFFGSGRYGLAVVPFVAALAFVPRESEREGSQEDRKIGSREFEEAAEQNRRGYGG
jgi:hypothetical protein